MVNDVKIVAGEECAPLHKFLVYNLIIKSVKEVFVPRRNIWKLRMLLKRNSVQRLNRIWRHGRKGAKVEDIWLCLKECLLEVSD